ncbi:unnamed protein product [Orchesella dallaii]|uniref:C2H2-type domain-containing protein n=1 Tax=Orchesella dallaii TaxID=48710 RepID=A0ABP1R8H9_9HEXA
MVSAWGLQCFLCETTFDTRKEWLTHLLQPLHQNQARGHCPSWDKQIKECVLVAFANFPVAKEDVLQLFQLRDRNTIVTDFVWSEHRARVGIIQFESREKANEVIEDTQRNPLALDGQLVQLRKATDFMDLEWDELLEIFHSNSDSNVNVQAHLSISKETRRGASLPSFDLKFHEICDEIVIPDKSFNLALDVMEKCRQIFATRYPSCNLYMFRHWYLQLKSMGTNELLFFVDARGQIVNKNEDPRSSNQDRNFILSASEVEKFLTSPSAQKLLPGVRKREVMDEKKKQSREPRAHPFVHEPSGLKFSLVTDSLFVTEVKTCLLVKHLMEFDTRVRPFLILIFYWAKRNCVEMSYPNYMDPTISHAFAPEPAALEWMMLTFLAQKRVIPKPSEILGRPHKQQGLECQKIDFRFQSDTTFLHEWLSSRASSVPPQNSNDFFLDVLQLIKEFFEFYWKLRCGTWILNTRDAEVIGRHDLFRKEPHRDFETKMTTEEIEELKRVSRSYNVTQVNLERWDLSILHPLFWGWCFNFHNVRFRTINLFKMKASAKIIGDELKELECGHGSFGISFKTMLRRVSKGKQLSKANLSSVSKKSVKKRKLDAKWCI